MDEQFNSKIPILNLFPRSQIIFNPNWSYLILFDNIWSYLIYIINPTWWYLILFDPIWSLLILIDAIKWYFIEFDLIWFNLIQNEYSPEDGPPRTPNKSNSSNDSKAAIAIPMDEEFNSKIPILDLSPRSQIP